MEIDESDDILFSEQTRLYNIGREIDKQFCDYDLDFINYSKERERIDGGNDICDSTTDVNRDECVYNNNSDNNNLLDELSVSSVDVSTRMTVDIKNMRGYFHLYADNLSKVMDIIAKYNQYNVIQKTIIKKTDCIGGYNIIYVCCEGMFYLSTYEFYDYATFHMDVCRVPERHREFFDIFDFLTEVFNSDSKSENINIITTTSK
jgi:hypothetical protein